MLQHSVQLLSRMTTRCGKNFTKYLLICPLLDAEMEISQSFKLYIYMYLKMLIGNVNYMTSKSHILRKCRSFSFAANNFDFFYFFQNTKINKFFQNSDAWQDLTRVKVKLKKYIS